MTADPNGLFTFVDTDARLYPMRFYRPIQPVAPPAPAAVADLTADPVSGSQIGLNWVDNSVNETSVTVEYSTSPTGPFQVAAVINVPPETTAYTVSGLSPGTQYYFRVKESNPYGDSPYSAVVSATTAPLGMAPIPAGSFTMGDTLDGEQDAIPITVYISAFYMDTNLVSYSQWQTVYNWATANGYDFDNAGSGKAANHPVQTVNWYDCGEVVQCAVAAGGFNPGVLHGCGFDAGLYEWGCGLLVYRELGGQWLSVADGSGVGEGGAGRIERPTVSVGQHDFRKPGQLLRRHRLL